MEQTSLITGNQTHQRKRKGQNWWARIWDQNDKVKLTSKQTNRNGRACNPPNVSDAMKVVMVSMSELDCSTTTTKSLCYIFYFILFIEKYLLNLLPNTFRSEASLSASYLISLSRYLSRIILKWKVEIQNHSPLWYFWKTILFFLSVNELSSFKFKFKVIRIILKI